MKYLQVLAVAGVLAGVSSAFAGTITFENAPPQTWELGSSLNGHSGGGQDLGGYYQGVTFGAGGQVTTTSTTFPGDGKLELTTVNPSGSLTMTFASPQSDVSFIYTTEFGIFITAQDKNGNFLTSPTGVHETGNVNLGTLVGTSSPFDFGFGNITTVTISDGLGFFTIDDLTAAGVNGLPVPDATGTFGLLGVAGLGLLAMRRKLALQ